MKNILHFVFGQDCRVSNTASASTQRNAFISRKTNVTGSRKMTLSLGMVLGMVLLAGGSVWGQSTSIWENPITGTNPNVDNPYVTGDVKNAHITVSGVGRGTGISGTNANDRYNANSWNTPDIDLNAYFNFTITPQAGYHINFDNLVYAAQASGTGPTSFEFRTDANGDNFTSAIGSPAASGATIDLTGGDYQNITTATSFRNYGWDASAPAGTYSINNFIFKGGILGTTSTSLSGFSACVNTAGTAQSFTVNGDGLSTASATITIAGTTNYEVSTTSAISGFSGSVTLTASGGSVSGTVWVRLKANATPGNYNSENVNVSGGGFSVGNDINVSCSGTVYDDPTITLGANPSVCEMETSANLPYSATTNSPDQYSIDYDAAAEAVLFSDVTNAALPATPIVLVVPGSAPAAVYNGTLTVRNSTTGCVSSSTPFTITVNVTPNANAGSGGDECDFDFQLDATPSIGIGVWTLTAGSGNAMFNPNANDPDATVTVDAYDYYTFTWTETNGSCSDNASVDVSFNEQPVADAGSGGNECDLNFQLNATLSVGEGEWTKTAGPGMAVFTPNAITANAIVTVDAYGTYTFKWTETNGACVDDEDIVVNFYEQVTASNAGPDQEICASLVVNTAGNTPSVGTGTWSQTGGGGVISFGDVNDPTTTATADAYGTYELTWTIVNGTCSSSSTVSISYYEQVATANAGPDQDVCASLVANTAGNTPSVGVGTWSQTGGIGSITFGNVNDPTTTAMADMYGTYELTWTVVNGTCSSSNTVSISYYEQVTTANAGPDQGVCASLVVNTAGNTPSVGVGTWSQTGGIGSITFGNVNDPTTTAMADMYGTYELTWTVVNGTCSSSNTVSISYYEQVTTANAGPDQEVVCASLATNLAANTPSIGGGNWSQTSGIGSITFADANDPATTATADMYGTYELTWTIVNGSCSSSSTVTVSYYELPVVSNQPNQTQCNTSTFTMTQSVPSPGTGVWTLVNGTATITAPSSPTTTVTGVVAGTSATVRWTVTNGTCSAFDDVTVTSDEQPIVSDQSNQTLCNTSTFTMTQSTPSVGTGVWTLENGIATITNPSSPTTTITGVVAGTNPTVRWTVTNGTCSAFDDVTVTSDEQPIVSDQSNQTLCNTSTFTMTQSAPSVGTGVWTLENGIATITNPSSPTTTITGVVAGTNPTVRWTVTNGTCSAFDDVTVTSDEQPIVSDQSNQTLCNTSTFTMTQSTPSVGTGVWTLENGIATITNPSSPTTTITGVVAGTNATVRWTVTNGTCSAFDEVTVTNDIQPVVSNQPDQVQCNTSTFTMTQSVPSPGTGVWTLVNGTATITAPSSPTTTVTGVVAGTSATVRWTVTNGTCSAFDEVIVTNNPLPTVAPITGSNYLFIGGTSQLANVTPMGVWGTSDANVATISLGGLVTGMAMGTAIISYTVTDNMGCSNSATLTITVDEPIIDIGLYNFVSPTPAGYNKLKVKIKPTINVVNSNYTSGIFTIRVKSSFNVLFTNLDTISSPYGYRIQTTQLGVMDAGIAYDYFAVFFERAEQFVTWTAGVEVDVLTLRYRCGAADFELVSNDVWTNAHNGNFYQELAGANAKRNITPASASAPATLSLSETHVNIFCGEVNTGSINITAAGGGLPAYNYDWQDIAGTNNVEDRMGLPAGTYTVTVSDGNGCTTSTSVTIQYLPVHNMTQNTDHPTIQAAIDAATTGNGETLQVCAGTYVENIIVNKELIINGPNASDNPCDGLLNAQAILIPAISGPEYNSPTPSAIMDIQADNVTIAGLTFDGDNPALTSAKNANGANIDAVVAIQVYQVVDNLTVTNNFIKNVNEGGVDQFYTTPTPSGDNEITFNKFDNIPGTDYGTGVSQYSNFYAKIDNNCMTRVRIGVQTGNTYLANPGAAATINNNQIQSSILGIWNNLQYNSASPWTISTNTLTTVPLATTNEGIFISSLNGTVTTVVSNNTVTGAKWGVELWNNQTNAPVTVSGGTLTTCETGVFANNYDGYASDALPSAYVLNAVNIVGGTTGIYVKDNSTNGNNATVSLQIQGNTIINGATTGLKIEGKDASASFSGVIPASFIGQAVYIDQVSNSVDVPNTNIDATEVLFDTETGATATLAENFVIEDKIVHKIDNGALGFVLVKAGQDFVTPLSGSIQRGVNAATSGFIENVKAGTYIENVIVDKSLTILGPNAANAGCGSRSAEAIVKPAAIALESTPSTSGTIFRLGTLSGHIDVTIKGLTIDGSNLGLGSGRLLNGIDVHTGAGIINSIGSFDTNPGAYDVTMIVQNNIIKNLERYGVLVDNTAARPAVTGNDVSYNKIDNLPSGNLYAGGRGRAIAFEENQYGSATYNCISRVNVGWQDDNYNLPSPGAATVVSNNTISSYHRGIFHNLNYQNASNATISNNTISAEPINNSGTDFGIELASIQTAVGATVTNNNVTGKTYGILLWNCPTTSTITVSGGTLTDNVHGIYATNNDPQFGAGANSSYVVDGVSIQNSTQNGVWVEDNETATVAVEIKNTTINGGASATGIKVSGTDASANIHNNTTGIADALIGVDVDGGTATVFRNKINANGTGIRTKNSGNLSSVTENYITNNTSEGIRIEANTGTVGLINYNDLSGNTGFAINDLLAAPQVDATCNWYGSAASGIVAGEVNGNVDYDPWLSSGTDSDVPTDGFQSVSCNGTPVVVVSAVPEHIICGEAANSGSIAVTFNGGTAPYNIAWTGGSATNVTSVYTIMGLTAGTYGITVTDVNGSTTTASAVVKYLPVTNTSDAPDTYYPTIQAAIDAATTVNGETLEVCAGIYTENIVVNKSLTIRGPQASMDADARFAAFTGGPANPKADPLVEAILTPATNNPTGGNPGANDQIRVLASGVTINGFVIDGNNPGIAGVSGTLINGVEVDGRRALTNVSDGNVVFSINNLNVQHNILQNFGQRAISLSGVGTLIGNTITENVIRSFKEQGVLLLTNAYVDVTNNTFEVPGSAIGLHLQNFDLNGSMDWSNNQVTVGQDAFGIHANLFYAPAGTLTINNNTVNARTGVTGTSDFTWGINVWSVDVGSTVAVSNNTVGSTGGQFGRGINLWNLPTTNTVAVTGGTVANSVIGINLDNLDPFYGAGNNTTVNVTGTSVTGGTIGIRARTEVLAVAPFFEPNIVNGNTTLNISDVVVDGAATGVQIKAPAASSPFTATGVVDLDSEVKNGATAGIAVVGEQAFGTIQNNDAANSITGNLIGVEVDGGTATVYRNRITANGTGLRAINGGNLSSVTENFITNNTAEGIRIAANAGTIGGINNNDISGNTTYSIHDLLATPAVNATCNWYGTANPNVFDAFIIGGVIYAPYLNAGMDNSVPTPGFQPAPLTCVDLTDFYVNDGFTAGDLITTAVGLDGPGTRGTVNRPYRHINTAINAAANGNTIRVDVGTYSDEQVLVDKDLTILGTTGSPATKPIINFTGIPDPMAPLALFNVTYPGVTIENFEFKPDLSNLGSAIVASDATDGVSNLTILNNTINPYRSTVAYVAFGLRNAININYGDPMAGGHRVNSSNPVNLLVQGNTIAYNVGADLLPGTSDDAGFRSGVAVDEGTGTFTANTLQTISQDIEVRFTNTANNVNITNNFINGGGVNFAAPNNGGGALNITWNTFDGAAGNTYTSSLRVKDNIDAAAMSTLIENNTFINHNWGISLENYKSVTVNNNTFTPASMSTTFRHITVNTKELNTSSATVMQTDIDGIFTKNKFYGSGIAGGKGMVFLNHDSDDDGYGVFTVGGAGVLANEFSSQIKIFMEMDSSMGASWPSIFPENNLGAAAITTMACWTEDINIEGNKFDVSGTLKLPINMSNAERATLESKLTHEPDNICLGLFIFFKPIEVTARVYLQGPYDTGTNKMSDALRQITIGPLFPLSTPYDTMPDFVKVNDFVVETTTAAVRDATGNDPANNAIVDWVWVELRAADTVTVVATRSALLQRDGDIVDMNGTSDVQFPDTYEGEYFLMVRHRNHLGTLTKAKVNYVGGSPFIDFSDPALITYGTTPTSARKLLEAGVYGLWAGNVNQKDPNNNWNILYNGSRNDRNEILKRVGTGTPLNIVSGYYHEDVNMNGETKYSGSGNDRVIILNNLGASNPLGNILQQPNN